MSQAASGRKFLVIGATGNVGGFVTPALLESGEDVRCMVRNPEKADPLRKAGAEVVIGDLNDRVSLKRAMEGRDTVFLVIANGPEMEQQGRNAIAAALSTGVTRLVRYSLIQIPGMRNLRTVKMQAAIDRQLESSGLQYSHVRPTNYMQFYATAAPTVQQEGKMYFPYGDAKVGMADVRDIAEVAVEVLVGDGHEGKSYSVTGPESITLHQVAEAISAVAGKKIEYVDVPEESTRQGLSSMGLDPWLIDEYMEFFAAFKRGDADIVTDDFEKLMGRKPRTIHDFARDYAGVFNPEMAAAAMKGL